VDLSRFSELDLSSTISIEEQDERIWAHADEELRKFWDLDPQSPREPIHATIVGASGSGKTVHALTALFNWYRREKRTIFVIDSPKGECIRFGKVFGRQNVIVHYPKWIENSISIRRESYTPKPYADASELLLNLEPDRFNIDLGFNMFLESFHSVKGRKAEFKRFVTELSSGLTRAFKSLSPATIYIEEAKNILPSKGHTVVDEQLSLSERMTSLIQVARGFNFNALCVTQGLNQINNGARHEMKYKFFYYIEDPNFMASGYLADRWFNYINQQLPPFHFFFWRNSRCYFMAGAIPPERMVPFWPEPVDLVYTFTPSVNLNVDDDEKLNQKLLEAWGRYRNYADVARHTGVNYHTVRYRLLNLLREEEGTGEANGQGIAH